MTKKNQTKTPEKINFPGVFLSNEVVQLLLFMHYFGS